MTISGITSTASLAYSQAGSRAQTQQPAGDQVSMSLSPETFSDLVSTASSMPEVRGELVDAYKSQIKSGHYPAQDVIEGLIKLMGGAWSKAAQDSSSSSAA